MTVFSKQCEHLKDHQYTWLVTGCAGFIGSNLTEFLLLHNQIVVGVDNFSTGKQKNLDDIHANVNEKYNNFKFIEGDIVELNICEQAIAGADFILHQAALGSVPRSIENPINTNNSNVTGFLNMLWQAKKADVKKFVFASSSSVYGDDKNLPKIEQTVGTPLSPYAVTKKVNELYAHVFCETYGIPTIGIRYFNVFGKRQDPEGAYAAVIPKWIKAMIDGDEISIFGDGETSRDFCYVKNVIQMNILAALSDNPKANGEVFNCAVSNRTTLTDLFNLLKNGLSSHHPSISDIKAQYKDFRAGDIAHSHANINKSSQILGYMPEYNLKQGLEEALDWYMQNLIVKA